MEHERIQLDECNKAEAMLWEAYNADPALLEKVRAIIDSDTDIDFLGFMGAYYHLSLIIPTDRTIYDLGCNHGFQAWFFRNHLKYVGVDGWKDMTFLELENTEYHKDSIEHFLETAKIDSIHFAICNYVGGAPAKLVREKFADLFVYYPKSRTPLFPTRPKKD
jgi:SAM-dependent methyltransferase